jgi:DNA-binding Xre family transcriptional regulator
VEQMSKNCGMAYNTVLSLTNNRPVGIQAIDKVCTYLKVQPADIMEWVPGDEALELERQIANMQKQLNKMKNLD